MLPGLRITMRRRKKENNTLLNKVGGEKVFVWMNRRGLLTASIIIHTYEKDRTNTTRCHAA